MSARPLREGPCVRAGYVAFSLSYLGEYIRSMNDEPAAVDDGWDAFPPTPSV